MHVETDGAQQGPLRNAGVVRPEDEAESRQEIKGDIVGRGGLQYKQRLEGHKVQLSCNFGEWRVERGIAVLWCTVEGHCDNG